jgi:hypothetical protein
LDDESEKKLKSKSGSSSSWSFEMTPPPTNMAIKPTAPRQCSTVQLGGANNAKGLSTMLSQRSCDALLCLSCNLKVVMFDNIAWADTTDYLFLRNNMPDLSRLKGG